MSDKDKEFVRTAIYLAMGAIQALGPAGNEHVGRIIRQLEISAEKVLVASET